MTDYKVLFWALIITGIFLLAAILIIGKALENYLKTDDFKNKLKEFKEREAKKIKSGVKLILLPILTFYSLSSLSIDVSNDEVEIIESQFYNRFNVNVVLILDLALLGFLLYLRGLFKKFYNINKKEEEIPTVEEKVSEVTGRVTQFLTDTVAVEDEHKILMNHEYDGIEELDNNLPPWWKFGFYLSIVAAVIYMFNYHILEISPLQEEEYALEIQQAEIDVAKYLKDQALNVDENTVVALISPKEINNGKKLFQQYCVACHVEGGAGNVGPNLTDDYWLYGSDIKGIFKTIKYGAKNGMKSWQEDFNPVQIQEVASYVLSLRGTNPPNAKGPEGDFKPLVITTVEPMDTLVIK